MFEAAWFNPPSVRATSKALGLKTEASMRFERGMDITADEVHMATSAVRLHLPRPGIREESARQNRMLSCRCRRRSATRSTGCSLD